MGLRSFVNVGKANIYYNLDVFDSLCHRGGRNLSGDPELNPVRPTAFVGHFEILSPETLH